MENYKKYIMDKCMDFSVRIVNMYKYIKEYHNETVLSKQLLRSATSIGANMAEAQNAISIADFMAKIHICQKECAETQYWLELLFRTSYLSEIEYQSINKDCVELKKLIVSTTKKIKEKTITPNS